MSIKYPYIAVICGEEHSIKGWNGNKLITTKGKYTLKHIYGGWRIQDFRIFEIVTIQPNNNGDWLLNGIPYSKLEKIMPGIRFASVKTDETLRARQENVCAVAWLDKTGKGERVVEMVDEILKFWQTAGLPEVEKESRFAHLEPTKTRLVGEFLEAVGEVLSQGAKFQRLFPAWSKPIWLTDFRPSNWQRLPTATEKQLAQATTQLDEKTTLLLKAQEAAGYNLQEAISKWMKFDPKGMSAERKAKIESAVRMYMTDREKHSLAKIAAEFKVSRKSVSEWFSIFTKETGFKVVKYNRHVSVQDQFQTESDSPEEE